MLWGLPLWSSGQSSWLEIQRPGFDTWHNQIFWEVVGLERGPLSLVSTTEELLERKSSGSDLESWDYGHRDPLRWPRGTLSPQKLALTWPTSGGHSVGIVRSRTQATEFVSVWGDLWSSCFATHASLVTTNTTRTNYILQVSNKQLFYILHFRCTHAHAHTQTHMHAQNH
jgi:hypothetical protein